ncbi:hypothetical protein [Cuneatibacter caecimuris]
MYYKRSCFPEISRKQDLFFSVRFTADQTLISAFSPNSS